MAMSLWGEMHFKVYELPFLNASKHETILGKAVIIHGRRLLRSYPEKRLPFFYDEATVSLCSIFSKKRFMVLEVLFDLH